jgi:chitin disaccharide deacetylase
MEPGLIVNADDLGVDAATTRGIVSAYRSGIVTSSSLIVTTPGIEEAVTAAQTAGMPLGLHLSLTQGCAVAGPHLDRLVDESGSFKLRARDLITLWRADTALIEQIKLEMKAQLRRALDLGVTLTHVDSHQHVHMNPVLFAILEEEASALGVRRMRMTREPFRIFLNASHYSQMLKRRNLSKWLITRAYAGWIKPRLERPDMFFGVLHSGTIVKDVLLGVLAAIPADRSVEICVHPGLPSQSSLRPLEGFDIFSASPFRRLEHDALIDPEVAELVHRRGITLRSFDGRIKHS